MDFLIGFVFGTTGVLVFALVSCVIWFVNELSSNKRYSKDEMTKIIKDAQTVGSISWRYTIIEGITKKQTEIMSQLDTPTKGTSHSKWKRGLIDQIKDMELEKMEVFRTILTEGVDPILVCQTPDGELEKLKMSEILKRFDENSSALTSPTSPKVTKTDSNNPCKNESNLIQMFKNKENQRDPSNPQTH